MRFQIDEWKGYLSTIPILYLKLTRDYRHTIITILLNISTKKIFKGGNQR